jgi:H+/Cl- antiporter ClcA
MLKAQQFFFILISVFVGTAGPLFLANVTNVFEVPWSTWQIIISGGIFGVVSYFIMWLAPQNKNFGLGSEHGKRA